MDVSHYSLLKEADSIYVTIKYNGVKINFDDESWNS